MIDDIKQLIGKVTKLGTADVEALVHEEELNCFDSLQFLNFVIELEYKFGISIEPEEMGEMKNFAKIMELLKNKGIG